MNATRPEKIKYVANFNLQVTEDEVNRLLKTNRAGKVDNWRLGAPLQFLNNQWVQTLVFTPE